MRRSDNEVLEFLLSDPDTPSATDLLTFARYAQEKRIWLRAYSEARGSEPSATEIEAWISNWTDFQFDRLRDSSKDFFDEAARLYLAEDMKAAKDSVRHESIIREVKAAGSWWRQLTIALITGILTPLILALLLFLATRHIPEASDIVSGKIQRSEPAR